MEWNETMRKNFSLTLLLLIGCKSPQTQTGVQSIESSESIKNSPSIPAEFDNSNPGELWSNFCLGDFKDVSIDVSPNYSNELVSNASKKLSMINYHSFALYRSIFNMHDNQNTTKPSGVSSNAHNFLMYLCGEYRDRPTMIHAKLNWAANMNYLSREESNTFDINKNPWQQMTAHDYMPYIDFTKELYYTKKLELENSKTKIGSFEVEVPVEPLTVCDVKYILSEKVRKKQTFTSLNDYNNGYNAFSSKCSSEDKDYYVDFRGDSNIKPNSPESNGMIWHSYSVALQCANRYTANPQGNKIKTRNGEVEQNIRLTDDLCRKYYNEPFASRWSAAKAGLGTWLLRSPEQDHIASKQSLELKVHPEFDDSLYSQPFNFTITDSSLNTQQGKLIDGWRNYWSSSSYGIEKLYQQDRRNEIIFERIKDAVNRHTNWYSSAYTDGMNQGRDQNQYSPFVASSYFMHASDGFVACGTTIPCANIDPNKIEKAKSANDSRHYKHFMYVFKIRKDKWYTPKDVANGKVPDFDHYWLDETSFGDDGLADSEIAFDRLGTPLEDELDTILYLHNICSARNGPVIAPTADSNGFGICDDSITHRVEPDFSSSAISESNNPPATPLTIEEKDSICRTMLSKNVDTTISQINELLPKFKCFKGEFYRTEYEDSYYYYLMKPRCTFGAKYNVEAAHIIEDKINHSNIDNKPHTKNTGGMLYLGFEDASQLCNFIEN